ncbi:hypothetical protein CYMTET_49033 [Cymbomonas tetramitiformis]|uniref:Rad51-like C-terminal domain-containing protein n=1 Tax=Cymbomonas tetramitiformis TaxID=36881 RepID=A0AAE0EUY2_9CHLO|nr:hypothetical protein CYMTET_49033 [Cymbomonas tetramitiformis]
MSGGRAGNGPVDDIDSQTCKMSGGRAGDGPAEGDLRCRRCSSPVPAMLTSVMCHPRPSSPDEGTAIKQERTTATWYGLMMELLEEKNCRHGITLLRGDFPDMAQRTRILNELTLLLTKAAHAHQLAVVTTNQVTTRVGPGGEATLVPALGESFAHSCTARCILHWQGGERVAHLIKSPRLPEGHARYTVAHGGIQSVVLERVQEGHPSMVIFAYLDDAFFLGPPVEAALAYETYMEEAVAIGLDIQPVKSAAFSPEGDASCFEAGMPGARGELDFIDVLGVPVGMAEAVSVEMLKKVGELCGILPLLNKLGHAQAQGLLLRFCAHPRLGFWLRGVLPEMMREAAEEHDRRMQGALRDLLPGGGLAWHSCEFATLPHGMGLIKAARVSSAAWLGGFAQVWEDMRELFPTVTAGTEDLVAESDLPYVNSLQAAMQKVSEAMEMMGEARGANEHLPPQVPKADDVKKLSDYSRSQKRAQRVYAAVPHSADWLWLAGHVGSSRLPWLFSMTFNNIGCPALELSSAEYRVALRHILHAEQPLLGQVEECPDCGGERDPTGTHLLACRGGVGAGGGNWYSFIHHKLQRVLFEVAKSAYPLASALHDDFAGYLTYSRNHCPDVTVLDAEGPGQHVLFDVATARPMSDAHLGAAMMAPGAAAKKVEESKVATYGDVRPHHFIPFGVEVYGGLGPAAYGFLRKTQRRFRERRYMEANAEGGEQVDGNGDEDEDEKRHVAGRRAVGRCPAGSGWRWAGGGRVGGGMGPDLDRGEADRREGAERLALMDRAWEDAFEETDYATQDGSGGGTQESQGTQRKRSGQASGEAGEAGAMASRLLESMEDVRREVEHLGTVGGQGGGTPEARSGGARAGVGGLSQAASSVEDFLNEWDGLLSPGPEGGVWTLEQSGASPEQAMALAEGWPPWHGDTAAVRRQDSRRGAQLGGRDEPASGTRRQCAGGADAEGLGWLSEA